MSCDICKLDHVTAVCPQQTGYGLGNKPGDNRIADAIAFSNRNWIEWGETFLRT